MNEIKACSMFFYFLVGIWKCFLLESVIRVIAGTDWKVIQSPKRLSRNTRIIEVDRSQCPLNESNSNSEKDDEVQNRVEFVDQLESKLQQANVLLVADELSMCAPLEDTCTLISAFQKRAIMKLTIWSVMPKIFASIRLLTSEVLPSPICAARSMLQGQQGSLGHQSTTLTLGNASVATRFIMSNMEVHARANGFSIDWKTSLFGKSTIRRHVHGQRCGSDPGIQG